ncbi:MAG: T9SS type A sorting domain-containing protein [Candidatus Cloacimonetes bacterium]|nr:T9SS type A sorting domain-containing protein [Candidatus Cloacimonadota bacterium]
MKKLLFSALFCLLLAGSLQAYFPLNFYGPETQAPLTKFEEIIVFTFGTYHAEMKYHYEATRLNSFSANFQPTTQKEYRSQDGDNWLFNDGVACDYDQDGRITTFTEIDEDGTPIDIRREIAYGYNEDIGVITFEWDDEGDPVLFYQYGYDYPNGQVQSVYIYHTDYGDSLVHYHMLNFYSTNEQGLFTGWVGRCYSVHDDIFSTGTFTWDDDPRLATYRFESPATLRREHVVIRGVLNWGDDRLLSITHLDEYTDDVIGTSTCVYGEDGLIEEAFTEYIYYDNPVTMFTFDYDEHGRLLMDTEYNYNADGTLNNVRRRCHEYNEWVGVDEGDTPPPASALTAYPNPFNPSATIAFSLSEPAHSTLCVFNVRGQRVATLLDETRPAGEHAVTWEADGLTSGIYFARLETPEGTSTTKLLLLK